MTQPDNAKHPLVYSLQIWISCAAAGPLLWYWTNSYGIGLTFNEFYWLCLLIGLIYMFPGFLILLALVAYIKRQAWELISKKFIVAGSALVVEITSCLIYFHYMHTPPAIKEMGFSVFVAYSLPLLLTIFLFRFPEGRTFNEGENGVNEETRDA